MIALTSTNHTLRISTSSSSSVDVCISYEDYLGNSVRLGDEETNISSPAYTTILSPPSVNTQRKVKNISVVNTTSSNSITVKKDITGSTYNIFGPVTLGLNERLEYVDGQGWKVFSNTGAIKTSLNQGSSAINSSLTAVVLSTDVINNNAVANTIADVTGLSFPVVADKTYYFKFIIPYTAAATTTGSRWSINGPTIGTVCYTSEYSLTSTTSTRNTNVIGYDLPASSNASSAGTVSGNMALIQGIIKTTADGSVIARFASEVANSAITAKAGAVVYYQELL